MQAASLALALFLGFDEPDVVLYDFGRPSCIYCQQINPVVDRLIEQGHPIVKVNCEEQPDLARQYEVRNLPTFILVVNGEVLDRQVGATSEQRLRSMLDRIPERTAAADSRPSGGSSQTSTSSAAPPPSRHIDLGQPGPFPSNGNTPGGGVSNQPVAESALPPISPAQVPRDRTETLDLQVVQDARAQDELPRANIDDADVATVADVTGIASMAASVRIRVIHDGRRNLGSGTLIVSQPGRSLIITCGHVFRDIGADAKIEVDVFINGEPITYVGALTDFDLEAEIGLITIPTERVLPVATIAPQNRVQQVHEHVASIGCSGGESPSREQHRITAINKYEGPDNLECTGTPVEGRSGGGLYNSQEELIGVCFARGEAEPLGLYAGPAAIYTMLDKYGLSALYESEATSQPATQVADVSMGNNPFATDEPQSGVIPPIELGQGTSQPLQPFAASPEFCTPETCGPGATISTTTAPLDFEPGDAEVVCLITQADGSRRVVVLHRASPKFVAYLNGELDASESITLLDDGTPVEAVETTAQRVRRPTATAVLSCSATAASAEYRQDAMETFQPTSLVQPIAPRPYVRQR